MALAGTAAALALGLPHAAHARRQGQRQPEPETVAQARQPTINVLPFTRLAELGRRLVEEGTPEGRLYEATKVTSGGKAFGLTFEMPKEAAAKMVADMLDRQAARGRD